MTFRNDVPRNRPGEGITILSLHHLINGLIDYAGLFPPAKLPMEKALAEYDRAHQGPHAAILSRFIVSAWNLKELARAAEDVLVDQILEEETPPVSKVSRELSVLCDSHPFIDRDKVDEFVWRAGRWGAKVEAVECKIVWVRDVAEVARSFGNRKLEIYCEVALDAQLDELVAEIAHQRSPSVKLGAKIRTGGVTEDAFPSPAAVAHFLAACKDAKIPFKTTAGLHHPLRGEHRLTYERWSPTATMHGFLNLFLAAVFLHAGKLDEAGIVTLLEERSPQAFEWSDGGVSWRGVEATSEQIASARREFAHGYGSCSFAEPIADLQALGLLPATEPSEETL